MKIWPAAVVISLILAGCAGKPAAPVAAPAAKAPAPAPAALAQVQGEPVDWYDAFPDDKHPANPPLTANACATAPGGGLIADVRSAEWRAHPLAKEPFQAPAATVVVCNSGTAALKNQYLTLAVTAESGAPLSSGVSLPPLEPGQALGPVRIYANFGVPERLGAWRPDWTLEIAHDKDRLGAIPMAGEHSAPLPDTPTLDLLRQRAWSQATVSADGQQQVQVFLYAPNAVYTVTDASFCGAMTGDVGANSTRWGLYISVDGAAPVLAKDLGQKRLDAGRGLTALPAPALGASLLLLGQYGSCAIPTWYEIYTYDHASGQIYRPQMQDDDGKVRDATAAGPQVTPDGALVSKFYSNAGENFGHNTVTYRWDAASRTWLFVSRTVTK